MKYERIILGAGMYGLYAATKSAEKGYNVLVLDSDEDAFCRGSYINQARLHNGYHYPRSYTTASKSAKYFSRFFNDFEDCINSGFAQIYAIAKEYSWTNSKQFKKFCNNLNLRCDLIETEQFFNSATIEKAFLTEEYSFDSKLIKNKLLNNAQKLGCDFKFGTTVSKITKDRHLFNITMNDGSYYQCDFLLNATYAGINQIHELLGYEMFPIKYELCEVILCNVSDNLQNTGLTVMDGPFFSIMPFGKTGYHSITTVSRTPHITCYDPLPKFECQSKRKICTPERTQNCNLCEFRPKSSFSEMYQIAKKYLQKNITVTPVESLFTLKPILKASEIDDSRPTIIRQYSKEPDFYTVFSGKINTMYDLDQII